MGAHSTNATFRRLRFAVPALLALLLTACGSATPRTTPPTPVAATEGARLETTPLPTSGPAETGAGATLRPLPEAECTTLQEALTERLKLEVERSEAPLQDPADGTDGAGCRLIATGTGENLPNVQDVAAAVYGVLGQHGWAEDQRYIADGPTGMATVFRQDSAVGLFSVGWQPAEGAGCPPNEPIMDCDLAPEQRLYTVSFTAGSR